MSDNRFIIGLSLGLLLGTILQAVTVSGIILNGDLVTVPWIPDGTPLYLATVLFFYVLWDNRDSTEKKA